MNELIIKKCLKCGALVKVINDCDCEDCGIECCNEEMVILKPNSVDASIEKHKPTYEIKDEKLIVTVNHVMEEDHYIEWICLVTATEEHYIYLTPGTSHTVEFPKVNRGIIYAYCNKHGLWQTEIE